MRIVTEKGLISAEKQGKNNQYRPLITKERAMEFESGLHLVVIPREEAAVSEAPSATARPAITEDPASAPSLPAASAWIAPTIPPGTEHATITKEKPDWRTLALRIWLGVAALMLFASVAMAEELARRRWPIGDIYEEIPQADGLWYYLLSDIFNR